MNRELTSTSSMRSQVIGMNVGDILVFSLNKMASIRSMVSQLSTELDRSYSTTVNRTARTLTVMRNS